MAIENKTPKNNHKKYYNKGSVSKAKKVEPKVEPKVEEVKKDDNVVKIKMG